MRYFRLTLQYLFKMGKDLRFPVLFLFAFPSAAAIGYYFPITGYINWFADFSVNSFTSYGNMWLSLISRDSLQLAILFIGYILLMMSLSVITTLIIRSMRTGTFQLKNVFGLINENFIPGFFVATVFFISLITFHSLACLFLFLWQKIFHLALALTLSVATVLILLTLLLLCMATQALWMPLMAYYGKSPFKAMTVSIVKSRGKTAQLISFYSIIFAIILGFGLLGTLVKNIWAAWMLNTVSYALSMVLLSTLGVVTFFDIEGITREDLVKRPYLRR